MTQTELFAKQLESQVLVEEQVTRLIEQQARGFSAQLLSITNSPVYAYLCQHFWCSPERQDMWHEVFKQAAIIYRRLRLDRSRVVMILGESGTGKEIFARAFAVGRKFMPINCTSLPDQLLESELFGHVAGAFTGAIATKQGLLAAAGDGVAFLDEIGDMPAALQAKLLRVLQDRTIRPVGSNIEQPITCMIVCASNQNLLKMLRNDLYWRLATYVIQLPSWRERLDEIDWTIRCRLDATSMLDKEHREMIITEMSTNCTGNFRQLQALVERAKMGIWLQRCDQSKSNTELAHS